MKPWEKYQQKESSGPWQKFSNESEPSVTDSDESVIEEMHPAFTTLDRLIVKNLSNNDEASINYLQKQHPDLQFKKNYDDRIIARRRDGSEKDWKPLDPDTGFFSTDFLQDVGDVGYDIVEGIGTAAGTAAGGILGSGVPVAGTLGGAAAGGAAAGGIISSLREGLGQSMGLDQDVSLANIGKSAGVGAASPLLFGTGATATQAALKSAGKKAALNPFAGSGTVLSNMAKSTARAGLNKVPFSGGSKLASKIPQNIGNSVEEILGRSGVADDSIEALAAQTRQILGDQSGLPVKKIINPIKENFLPGLAQFGSGIHKNVIKAYSNNPEKIAEISESGIRPFLKKEINTMRNAFLNKRGSVGNEMTQTRELIDMVQDSVVEKYGADAAKDLTIDSHRIMEPFFDIHAKALEKNRRSPSPANAQTVAEIEAAMNDFFNMESVENIFEISSVGKGAEDAFDLKQTLKKIQNFGKDDGTKYSFDTRSQLSQAAKDTGRIIDNEIDRTLGAVREYVDKLPDMPELSTAFNESILDPNMMYSDLVSEYGSLRDAEKFLKPMLATPESGWRSLSNIASPANASKMEYIQNIDDMLGTQLADKAHEIAAAKVFLDPSWLAQSSGGTTSTSRTGAVQNAMSSLGYLGGAQSGIGQGMAGVGQAIGGAFGGVIAGPKALRNYMHLNRNMGRGERLLRDSGLFRPQGAAIAAGITPSLYGPTVSAWEMMRDRESDK